MIKKIISCFLCCIIIFVVYGCNNKNKYKSWHLNSMKIDELWKYSMGDSQTIAFIDTGISDELANMLSENIVYRFNVFDKTDDITDMHGHGTEMVSVACSNGYDNVWGIAPNSKIIIIKAVSDEGKTNNENLYTALKVAQNNGATIVNISLGGYKTDEKVVDQINTMIKNGITIVAAAGDYKNKDLLFPANQDGVISVEALDRNNLLWSDSNTSYNSIVRMPGVKIDVLTVQNNMLNKSIADGTSQASSITSAYIALIKDYYISKNMEIDNDMLMNILYSLKTKSKSKVNYLLPFEK